MKKPTSRRASWPRQSGQELAVSLASEEFLIRLPNEIARRVRFLAAWEEVTPEAFIAEAATSSSVATSEGYASHACKNETDSQIDVHACNGSPKGVERWKKIALEKKGPS